MLRTRSISSEKLWYHSEGDLGESCIVMVCIEIYQLLLPLLLTAGIEGNHELWIKEADGKRGCFDSMKKFEEVGRLTHLYQLLTSKIR